MNHRSAALVFFLYLTHGGVHNTPGVGTRERRFIYSKVLLNWLIIMLSLAMIMNNN